MTWITISCVHAGWSSRRVIHVSGRVLGHVFTVTGHVTGCTVVHTLSVITRNTSAPAPGRVTWQRRGPVLHVAVPRVAGHVSTLCPLVSMVPMMGRGSLPRHHTLPAVRPGPVFRNIVRRSKLISDQMSELLGFVDHSLKNFFGWFRCVGQGALFYITNLLLVIFKFLL